MLRRSRFASLALAVALAGCAAGAAGEARPPAGPGTVEPSQPQATFADDEADHPAYGKAELARALASERELAAQQDKKLVQLATKADEAPSYEQTAFDDQLRVARADLAVRRRFIATLEACDATSKLCPPRLDDPSWSYDPDPDRPVAPPLTSPLRFDLASWRTLAAELHGRACACRTQSCVDSVTVVIDQLEPRPMLEVQGDDAATTSITAARTCLFRLRGKIAITTAPVVAE